MCRYSILRVTDIFLFYGIAQGAFDFWKRGISGFYFDKKHFIDCSRRKPLKGDKVYGFPDKSDFRRIGREIGQKCCKLLADSCPIFLPRKKATIMNEMLAIAKINSKSFNSIVSNIIFLLTSFFSRYQLFYTMLLWVSVACSISKVFGYIEAAQLIECKVDSIEGHLSMF